MIFSVLFFLSLSFLVHAAEFPLFAKLAYIKKIGGKEQEEILDLFNSAFMAYPSVVGLESFKASTKVRKECKRIYLNSLQYLHRVAGNLSGNIGGDLYEIIKQRIDMFEFSLKLAKPTESQKQLVDSVLADFHEHLAEMPKFEASKQKAINQLISDCDLILQIQILASTPRLFNAVVQSKFFLLIYAEFASFVELVCDNDNERTMAQQVYKIFYEAKWPCVNLMANTFANATVPLPVTVSKLDLAVSNNSDHDLYLNRVQRRFTGPLTTDRVPIEYCDRFNIGLWYSLVEFFDGSKRNSKHILKEDHVMSHLEMELERADKVFASPTLGHIFLLEKHFGVSGYADFQLKRDWLYSFVDAAKLQYYETLQSSLLGREPLGKPSTVHPLRIEHTYQTSQKYSIITLPHHRIVPSYLNEWFDEMTKSLTKVQKFEKLYSLHRFIESLVCAALHITCEYDKHHTGDGEIPSCPQSNYFFQAEFPNLLLEVYNIADKRTIRSRLSMIRLVTFTRDTLELYVSLARSGDLYKIDFDRYRGDYAFLSFLYPEFHYYRLLGPL